jgi:coproporphyrinogen III oxidase-like Fe-S oxidoreductase
VHRLKRAGCWMLALGVESESDEVRKDMAKRLERQKIQTAFRNMRDAGIKSFAFFIFGYPGETSAAMDQTIDYAIELDPDFANFYPAVPYPGTALYDKCVREGLLPAGAAEDWSKLEYSYYVLEGNGLNARVVNEAINRAKRRFFLRPAYMARHIGDVARLAMTKQAIVWQVLSRTVFGARVVDTAAPARRTRSLAAWNTPASRLTPAVSGVYLVARPR